MKSQSTLIKSFRLFKLKKNNEKSQYIRYTILDYNKSQKLIIKRK